MAEHELNIAAATAMVNIPFNLLNIEPIVL